MMNGRSIKSRLLSLMTCIVTAFSAMTGCAEKEMAGNNGDSVNSQTVTGTETTTTVTTKPPEPSATSAVSATTAPETEIPPREGETDDIYSLVCASVAEKLSSAGFDTYCGYSVPIEAGGEKMRGLCYTDKKIKLLNSDDIETGGFVEIISSELSSAGAGAAEEPVTVTVGGDDGDKSYLCAYNYKNIGSSHFVYKGKYVKYSQTSSMRIEYTEMENTEDNYDLELGSLYDYDHKRYLYDESIFSGDYETHRGIGLFKEEDYEELEKSLAEMARQQEKNGYSVETCSVVYISPESVQAVIDGKAEDKLFGYSVGELEQAFGRGTELTFTDGVPTIPGGSGWSVTDMISGSGSAKRFIAGGIIIISIGLIAKNGVSVTKSFISVLKNRKFLIAELKKLIGVLTEFASKCSENIGNGMSISNSLIGAVSEQSGELLDEMLLSTAIVTSSVALNTIKSGYGDNVVEYSAAVRSAWDSFDEIYEKVENISWEQITESFEGGYSFDELSEYFMNEPEEQLNDAGLVVYSGNYVTEIESGSGTVVELVPEIADKLFKSA